MRLLLLISLLLAMIPAASAIGTSQCAGSAESGPGVACAFVTACCGADGSFFIRAGSHGGLVLIGGYDLDVEATTSGPTSILVCRALPPDPILPPDPVCTALTPPDPCHAALPFAPPDPCRAVPNLLP